MKCGLLGEKLGHSYSPQIHAELADYEYLLYERKPDEVGDFILYGDWHGLNVTIPYKKKVIPFCTELSENAKKIGAVNTLLKRNDGSIYAENTDAFGFSVLLRELAVDLRGQKTLVLGSGGASLMAQKVLQDHGAEVVVISRNGKDNYENIKERHADASLIVNTTPVGMYPNTGVSPVNLCDFPVLRGVADVVYNPVRTALLLQAEKMGIPCAGGLTMLVAQAKKSAEIFTGKTISDEEIDRIARKLSLQMQNLVLIGMPGCGKSTIGRKLAEKLSRTCIEADQELEHSAGMTIPVIFASEGEEGFRIRETEILRQFGKQSGLVISTGGGCVTKNENYPLLHQNGILIWLQRDIEKLPKEGRPLSEKSDLHQMAAVRNPMYKAFADYTVDNNGTADETVEKILRCLDYQLK